MKQIIKTTVCLLILSVLFQSCYTSRPIAGSVSSPDYNKRVNVSNAQYKKKSNALDIVFNVGLIGAGAYGGYNMNLIQQQTATGKEPVRVANAAVGALAGATVAYLIDQIAGKNKIYPVTNPNNWIKKANSNYRFLAGSNSNFTIINSNAENSYTVKNINDVRDFKTVFPNSSQTDNVFKQGINSINRTDLPTLIDLYPSNQYVGDAKMKYIESSPSYDDIAAAVKKYPVSNAAELCVDKIENVNNALNFASTYSSFNNKRLAVANAFKSKVPLVSEMNQLKNAYGQDFNLTVNDLYSKSENIKGNYFNAMYLLQSPKSVEQFDNFNSNYTWLSYSNKKTDLLSKYWDLIEPNYSTGTDVLQQFGKGLANPIYADIKISEDDFKKVINEKFKKIIEDDKKVQILNIQSIGSDATQWETWKKSPFTALVVQEQGEISYMVFGEVQNNSKFDLPVEIQAGGTLFWKVSAKAGNDRLQEWANNADNFLSNLSKGVGELIQALGLSSGEAVPDFYDLAKQGLKSTSENIVGFKYGSYYIPEIPAGGKYLYATKIDFGEGDKKIGGNALVVKMSIELILKDEVAKVRYYPNPVSKEQLELQNAWQYFAKNGLPAGTLYDKFWGEGVKFNQTGYDDGLNLAWTGFLKGAEIYYKYIKPYTGDSGVGSSYSSRSSDRDDRVSSESNSISNNNTNNTTTTDWSKYYLKVKNRGKWETTAGHSKTGNNTYKQLIEFENGYDGGYIYKELEEYTNETKLIRVYSGDGEIGLNLKDEEDAIHCLAIRKHHNSEYSKYLDYLKERDR